MESDRCDPTSSGAVDGPPDGLLTAEQVARRLSEVTGRRAVSASTIRAMASRGRMPAPVATRWRRRALWDEQEIGPWLQERARREVPRDVARRIQRRLTAVDESARASGNDARLKQAVRDARRRGLSYQQIADAITTKDGDRHPSREAVRARFGPYL